MICDLLTSSSALRLCVRLFDDCYFLLPYSNKRFLLTFRVVLHPISNRSLQARINLLYSKKKELEEAEMPRYTVTLTDEEEKELKALIQKGGKGYRIKHAQILLKLDKRPENEEWTYDRIKEAYGASHNTIAGVAKRFVMEGMEAALGRKEQKNRYRKVTGEVEAQMCLSLSKKSAYGRLFRVCMVE